MQAVQSELQFALTHFSGVESLTLTAADVILIYLLFVQNEHKMGRWCLSVRIFHLQNY